MKIIFNCHVPFMLAHGGAQVQIERTKSALAQIGVETDYLQWWNGDQTTDILHHVGFLPTSLIELARNRGWKVVNTILLTQTCNRSKWELLARKICIRAALRAPLPRRLKAQLPWLSYRECDRMIVGLEAEREVLAGVYGVRRQFIRVVPLGLTETFLRAPPAVRSEDHLICTGRIGPSKNSLELARLAIAAEVPILFVGKPLDSGSLYWREFCQLVDNKHVKHHEHVGTEAGMVDLLRKARGYVLMSRYENWCLAAHEAAACGLPLLLPNQVWSRERFRDQATYWPRNGDRAMARALRQFYERSPSLPAARIRLSSWQEVARQLEGIYQELLNPSTAQ